MRGCNRWIIILTEKRPLSSATREGPRKGRWRRSRVAPSCRPTRPSPGPSLCPFACPCRVRVPFPDPAPLSPWSRALVPADAPSRSRRSSPAPSRAPGFSLGFDHDRDLCPTLFRPTVAKMGMLQKKHISSIYPCLACLLLEKCR